MALLQFSELEMYLVMNVEKAPEHILNQIKMQLGNIGGECNKNTIKHK